MADRRSYSETEKTEALALYETEGPAAVERKFGIPKGTVSYWATKANVRTVRTPKTAAATEASSVDAAAVRQLVASTTITSARKAGDEILRRLEESAEEIPARDLTTMFGVLIDKHIALVRLDAVENDHSAVDAWIEHMIEG